MCVRGVVPERGQGFRGPVEHNPLSNKHQPLHDLLDRAELVRDVQNRDAELAVQPLEQLRERFLRRHVDPGRGLLTGGDTITARHLYKEFFEFLPQFKLWLAANARPRVSASDSGMWRRIVQVPFAEAIPEEERDPRIKLRLKNDPQAQSAVLAWALEGCRAWQEQGLVIPERVRRYTEEYRAENDPLADFFEERCVFEPRAVVRRSELRKAYEDWARENGEWPVAPRTLAGALKARGGNDGAKLGGERAWRGVRLRLSERLDSLSDSDSPF
jgi:putative DNA primase/helicase